MKRFYEYTATLKGHNQMIMCVEILNGYIVSGAYDNTIKVGDPIHFNCIATLLGHTNYINNLIGLPNNTIASGSTDGTIRIWDENYKCKMVLQNHKKCLATLPNGQLISGSVDNSIKIWV